MGTSSPISGFRPGGETRFAELDGIRGWAALSVMMFHFFWEMFGAVEPSFRTLVSALVLNGSLAVSIFFVLSGDALSASYWRTRDRTMVVRLAVKRYPRLTVPIASSCLLVFVLIQVGLIFNSEAGYIVDRPRWLGSSIGQDFSVLDFIEYSFVGVYFYHSFHTSLNPFLWTMSIELFGSLFVFLFLFMERHLKRTDVAILLIICLLLVAESYIACFMVGVMFGKLRAEGHFERLRHSRWVMIFAPVCLATIAALAATMAVGGKFGPSKSIMAASLIVYLIYASTAMSALFRIRFSQWLGKLSFAIYLVHYPVLVSLTSWLVIATDGVAMDRTLVYTGIAVISTLASLALAVAFQPIERLTAAIGNYTWDIIGEGKDPWLTAVQSLRWGRMLSRKA